MKKPKPIIVKSVASTVSASILITSCSSEFNFEDSYYGAHTENLTRGVSLIELNESNLSEEFLYKLNVIQQIIDIVLTDKKEAKNFAENPDSFVSSKELNFNISLYEAERKLLLAFADDDILRAVKEKDIETFLSLCSERGYIGIINEYNRPENVRSMFKSDEEYESFMQLMENLEGSNYSTRAVAGVPVLVVAGAAVYMGAVAIYAAGAAITVGYATLVAAETGIAVNESIYVNSEVSRQRGLIGESEQTLRIWTENNGIIAEDAFYTELIDKQTNLFMEVIEKEFVIPSSTSETIRHLLKIQLEGYYGLRRK